MSYERIHCASAQIMENAFSELQRIYRHVEFVSYENGSLVVAYIA